LDVNEIPLYLQIANALRQQILDGELEAGAQLPTVRDMADRWSCAPGTVQRAFNLLSREGFVKGRTGHGTHVAKQAALQERHQGGRIALASEVDTFLQRLQSSGFSPDQIERSLWFGLDRLRAAPEDYSVDAGFQLLFVGSHDPLIAHLSQQLADSTPPYRMQVRYTGSLGGLMALAQGEADLAGCHLWDPETKSYNTAYVRRLLPGRRVALVTLAHRWLGLILQPGNPFGVRSLKDLKKEGLRFINRQIGAGTRVWLEAQLLDLGIVPDTIAGYETIAHTHADVCATIAAGQSDLGLGIQSAAVNYDLDFIPLTVERYDLAIDGQRWDAAPIQNLLSIIHEPKFMRLIESLAGYETEQTGNVQWVNRL
jgi:molybdate-binding protein/DNA-binding transcriptional regulator YhcF (GntR family)